MRLIPTNVTIIVSYTGINEIDLFSFILKIHCFCSNTTISDERRVLQQPKALATISIVITKIVIIDNIINISITEK